MPCFVDAFRKYLRFWNNINSFLGISLERCSKNGVQVAGFRARRKSGADFFVWPWKYEHRFLFCHTSREKRMEKSAKCPVKRFSLFFITFSSRGVASLLQQCVSPGRGVVLRFKCVYFPKATQCIQVLRHLSNKTATIAQYTHRKWTFWGWIGPYSHDFHSVCVAFAFIYNVFLHNFDGWLFFATPLERNAFFEKCEFSPVGA